MEQTNNTKNPRPLSILLRMVYDKIYYNLYNEDGICNTASLMVTENVITAEEENMIHSFLDSHKPFFHFLHKPYFWYPYKRKPRLKYLKKHINKLKHENKMIRYI